MHLRAPLSCPLQIVDRCTGETIRAAWLEQTALPLLQAFRQEFGVSVDVSTCDRAGSNLRAEASVADQRPWPRMTLPCDIHTVHTIQGHVYCVVGAVMSGLLAFALAQRPCGAVAKLRTALEGVLLDRVEWVEGPLPAYELLQSRSSLFDLCLPSDSAAQRARRSELESLFQSDPRRQHIFVDGHLAGYLQLGRAGCPSVVATSHPCIPAPPLDELVGLSLGGDTVGFASWPLGCRRPAVT